MKVSGKEIKLNESNYCPRWCRTGKNPSEVPERVDFMKDVATTGYELLRSSHDALDTAVEVVKMLEDNSGHI